jgi:hypothetical protein
VLLHFQKGDYQTIKPLALDNAGAEANITTYNKILYYQIASVSGNAEVGGGFNQS